MTTRRELLTMTAAGAAAALGSGCAHASPRAVAATTSAGATRATAGGAIPKRPFGRTGALVSVIGIGGSHLGEAPSEDEAQRIVREAIDAGVTFFDNAWEYHDGKSEERRTNAGWPSSG